MANKNDTVSFEEVVITVSLVSRSVTFRGLDDQGLPWNGEVVGQGKEKEADAFFKMLTRKIHAAFPEKTQVVFKVGDAKTRKIATDQ
jgi:hypothetical protein